MLEQVAVTRESLAAGRTHVWLDTAVDAAVHDEGRSERERFTTRRTDERFLLRVDPLVTDQVGFSMEGLAADGTLERLHPAVYVPVAREIRRVLERAPAHFTGVGSLASVRAFV